jgi:hypothetical protein
MPSDDDALVYRVVYPVTALDGVISEDESGNLIAVVHEKDWDDEIAVIEVLAREYAERRRKKADGP